ncbi:MAG: glycosyltransferase [Methanomicrobiales archaeon]|nr:glycosyltransferase [Methanomicrobiales archaeon]
MFEKPYITIITSTYNASETLERCLLSVERQTFSHLEHIIVDGGSVDGTVECIRSHAQRKDSRISWWVSEPDTGIYNAWNKALPHIKGEWVQFLGADDYLYAPGTMEQASQHLTKADPGIPIVYGKIALVSEHTKEIKQWNGKAWKIMKKPFYRGKCLPHPATFHRSDLFQKCGGFDESFRISGDYDFLIRVLKGYDAYFMDLPIVMMQMGGVSTNTAYTVPAGYEVYRLLKKNKLNGFSTYLKYYLKFRGIEIMYNYFPRFTVYIRNIVRKWKGEELISSPAS